MMIEVKNLNKKYDETILFDDASFTLPSTGLFILNSDNGSGKTTLLKILVGIEKADSSEILFNNQKIKDISSISTYIDQKYNFVSFLNLNDNYNLSSFIYKNSKTAISENNLVFSKRKKPSRMSEGEKVLFLLDRAFNDESQIILLDEVTSHLDDSNTDIIFKKIVELSKKKLILFATHDYRIQCEDFNQILIEKKKISIKYVDSKLEQNNEGKTIKLTKKPANLKLFLKYISFKPLFTTLFLMVNIFLGLLFTTFIYVYSFNPMSLINNDFLDDSTSNITISGSIGNYEFGREKLNIDSSGDLNKADVNTILSNFGEAGFGIGNVIFNDSNNECLIINQEEYKNIKNANYEAFGLTLIDDKIIYIVDGFNFQFNYEIKNVINMNIDYDYFLSSLIRERVGSTSIIFENELHEISDKTEIFKGNSNILFTDYSIFLEKQYGQFDNYLSLNDDEIIVGEKYKKYNNQKMEMLDLSEFNLRGDQNKYFDYESAFPSGVKVIYDEKISPLLNDKEVLVSKNSFDNLINCINFKRKCLDLGDTTNLRVYSYMLFGNADIPINSLTYAFFGKNNTTEVKFNGFNSRIEGLNKFIKTRGNISVIDLSMLIACLALFFFSFYLYFSISKKMFTNDFKILEARGLNKSKRIIFESCKALVLLLGSIIPPLLIVGQNPGIALASFSTFDRNPFSFNATTLLWIILIYIVILIIVFFVNFKEVKILIERRQKK